MSKRIAAVEDYLNCPVCLETFKEPVSLGCNHSFCSSCLHNYWDKNHTKNCPVCRRKSSKDILEVNFALKELCISFSKKENSEAGEGQAMCGKHPEVTHMFCLDESQVFCAVCEFSQHSGHKVVSVEAAVEDLKQQLQSLLQPLTEKRHRVRAEQRLYEDMVCESQRQAQQCEQHISALFSGLQDFLKEQEESALAALREEQHRQAHTIGPQLDNIREQLSYLDLSIRAVEEHLQKDSIDFITEYTHTHTTARSLITHTNPKLQTGLLLNQAKVLGNLGFKVWEKMRGLVPYSPVILDPNTAEKRLCLSEDMTSISRADPYLELPDNPERFTYNAEVLGSEGWTSGRHQWDVEVGDHPEWAIGVAKESVNRKDEVDAYPENGYWSLTYYKGEYFDVDGNEVKLKKSPQKIRVQLDCDKREVCFYNTEDMSLICSLKHKITEKLFPYFSIGRPRDAKTKDIKICSSDAY